MSSKMLVMIDRSSSKEKVLAAYKLLQEDSTTKEKFESITTLLKGINPKIDQALARVSKAGGDLEKIEKGEVIELTLENIPAESEEEKKRKKRLLLFIRFWKDLKSEVERVKLELERGNQTGKQDMGKITAFAKGPFGIITVLAIIIVVGTSIFLSGSSKDQTETPTPAKPKIKVIEFQGKKIALTELTVGVGPECDQEPHYHAKDHNLAKALDGTLVSDPGGCGYGKVSQVRVLEM